MVTGGTPPYTYEWSTNKDDAGWVSQGTGSSWTFNTTGGDAGTYAVRCVATDSLSETGEVIWDDFVVSTLSRLSINKFYFTSSHPLPLQGEGVKHC